MFVKMLFHH